MTITQYRGEPSDGEHLVRRAGLTARSVPYRVTTALTSYLDAVTEALTRWKVPVAGVEVVPNDGVVSGRITLAGQRDRRSRPSFELRWFETTGWEFDLHHAGDPEPMPWRFLHFSLVPAPAHVASFTDGLLRGEDLGMAHPARFRRPGDDLPALTDLLRCHSRDRAAHPLPGSSPRPGPWAGRREQSGAER